MKKLLIALMAAASFTATAARPIDSNPDYIKDIKAANAFADYVVALGYRCDSISSFNKALWSSGKFKLNCNGYRYTYIIEDKGGRWVVTVD